MNRRDILKSTLLTPFLGLFGGDKKKSSSIPKTKQVGKVEGRMLVNYTLTCDTPIETLWTNPYHPDISGRYIVWPVEVVLKIEVCEHLKNGDFIFSEEEYTAFNPGGTKTEKWLKSVTRKHIEQALLNSTIDEEFRFPNFEAQKLNINRAEFRICSITHIIKGRHDQPPQNLRI